MSDMTPGADGPGSAPAYPDAPAAAPAHPPRPPLAAAPEPAAGPRRGGFRLLGRDRRQFVWQNAVAAAGTWIAGVLGLLLQALVSHHVRPAVYGEVFAVFTFFTLLTQPAAAVSRLITWTTSQERAAAHGAGTPESDALLRLTNLRMITGGAIIALLFLAFSPTVAHFLGVPVIYVLLGAAGVPFLFATAPLLAAFQGRQRWGVWSGLSIGIALARVVFVFTFILLFGVVGVLLGISVAAAVIYFMALALVWPRIRSASGSGAWGPHWRFLVVSVASTVMAGVLLASDVIVVQHVYHGAQAGQFSASAVTSRALFFAWGSVSSVLFPLVAVRHKRGQSARTVVLASVIIAIVGGAIGLGVFELGGASILHTFSGKAYTPGAGYIGWYALGMPLLAAVVMLSNTQQSLASLRLLWVLVPATLIKPVLLVFFHQSLLIVAVVSDLSIALVLIALTVMYLVGERRWIREPRAAAAPAIAPARAAPPIPRVAAEPRWAPLLAGMRQDLVEVARDAVNLPRAWAAATWREIASASGVKARIAVVLDHPALVIAVLAVVGVAIRHAWISTQPLSAGDWHWPDPQRVAAWSPWPSVWDSTLGAGGENRFVEAFRFPVFAIEGFMASLGATWTFIEKVIYFIPFAVLLPAAGWLLAREVLGRTRWALLTPLLLVGNTYFMLESDGEIPLALAEAITLLALFTFIRAMRGKSLGYGIVTGLLVALTTFFDIRPAYLAVVLMLLYFATLLLVERDWPTIKRRLLIGATAGCVYIASQAFWLLPLLTYHGNAGLPTPQSPDFNIITLGHGLAGVSAFWTGSTPANLVQASLNPAYMILPLIALMPLLARRVRPEIFWLATAALLFAFFAKTDNPPFGGLYDFMYLHVPGWKLFREGSKFLYIVGLAYAILIPAALQSAYAASREWRVTVRDFWLRTGSTVALAGVAALSALSVAILQTGALQSTTVSTPEPESFSDLSTVLASDSQPGSVLWFGQPLIASGTRNHHFLIASPTHPAVNLTGNFNNTKINQRDPFQLFCADNLVPYCYLDQQLFPYLAYVSGASYIVVPGGNAVGSIPSGISRGWLRAQMTAMYGAPHSLGSGDTALAVWHIDPAYTVTVAPAVSLIDSGPWATEAALPAILAMGLPAAYRQTYYESQYPVASPTLTDTVRVLPRLSGGCSGTAGGDVGIMAMSNVPELAVTVGGQPRLLTQLVSASRLPGWSVYGPTPVGATDAIASTEAAVQMGPCIVWSPLAATALGVHGSDVGPLTWSWHGERVTASAPANMPWVQLRRYYDPGWRLNGAKPVAAGGALFDLYHVKPTTAADRTLSFSFSTLPWEELGQVVAVLSVMIAVVAAVALLRRDPWEPAAPLRPLAPSRPARLVAAGGIAMVGASAAAVAASWFGVFSSAPQLGYASDPYGLDVGYGGAAIALLLVSVLIRAGVQFRGSSRKSAGSTPVRVSPRLAAASLVAGVIVALSACGESPNTYQNLLNEAQQAGAVSPTIGGASLDDARLARSARDAPLCIADYTTALHYYSDLVTAYSGRAGCYLNGGRDGGGAVQDFTAALTLAPGRPDLLLGRAVAYRATGEVAAAAADYLTAARAAAADASQQLTAIDGLIAMGDLSDARSAYALAAATHPDTALLYVSAADIATAASQDDLATQYMARAEQLMHGRGDTATVLAHVCNSEVLHHLSGQALTDCATSARLSSGGSGALDDLAAAELQVGDLGAALDNINASISAFIGNVGPYAQEAGVDGFGLSRLYTARAWIQIQLHRRGAALHSFQLAVEALPSAAPDARARLKAFQSTARVD